MAQRDRTQGFGFVYLDVAKLLREAHLSKDKDLEARPSAPHANFPIVEESVKRVPAPIQNKELPKETQAPVTDKSAAVAQVKENLERLQGLHHKLHAMLDELNKLTGKKKK